MTPQEMPLERAVRPQERRDGIVDSVSHTSPQRLTASLPIPPSINNLYATVRGRRVLSAAGRAYHHDAGWLVKEAAMKLPWRTRAGQRYSVEMVLYFADRRPRDLDNCTKIVIDSAAAALGFNDARVDVLVVRRGPVDKIAPRCELTIGVL